MNKSRWYLGMLAFLGLTLAGLLVEGRSRTVRMEKEVLPQKMEIVRLLGLTDPCLWTEARYTRHPSQADFFSPFQDLPGSLDHFPSGSLLAPPPHAGRPPLPLPAAASPSP